MRFEAHLIGIHLEFGHSRSMKSFGMLWPCLLLQFSQLPVASQPGSADDQILKARQLRRQGRKPEAEQTLRSAITQSESASGNRSLVVALNNLAALLVDQGRYSDAAPLAERAVALAQQDDDQKGQLVILHSQLGLIHSFLGNYAKAERLLSQARLTSFRTLGAEHPDTLMVLQNSALVAFHQKQYTKAERFYTQVVAVRKRTTGTQDRNLAAAMTSLGEVYRFMRRYDEAETLSRQALEIRKAAVGPLDPVVVLSLTNLASVCLEQGR